MVQTTMIVAINRPVAQVFAFVADAETAPQWQSEIVEVRRITMGLIGVGATYQALRTHLRERIASTLEITEYELNKKVSFESIAGPIQFRDSYIFQSIGDCTRVTYGFDLATRARGARHVFSREAADLSNLKSVLETQRDISRHIPVNHNEIAAHPAPAAAGQLPRAEARAVGSARPSAR